MTRYSHAVLKLTNTSNFNHATQPLSIVKTIAIATVAFLLVCESGSLTAVATAQETKKSAPTDTSQQRQQPEQADNQKVSLIAGEQLDELKKQLADQPKEGPVAEKLQALLAELDAAVASLSNQESALAKRENGTQTAESRAETFQTELKQLKAKEPEPPSSTLTDEVIAAQLIELETQVEEYKTQLQENENESAARNSRAKEPRRIEAVSQQISELSTQLEAAPTDGAPIAQASLLKLKTELALAELKKAAFQAQDRQDDAELKFGLLNLQHDLIELRLKRSEHLRSQLDELQRERQQSEAEKELRSIQKQESEAAEAKSPLLPSYVVNTQIAKDAFDNQQEVAAAKENADRLQEAVKNLNEKYRKTKRRVTEIGLTGAVGAMLRKRREDLLETVRLGKLNDTESKIDDIQYKLFDLDQQYQDLSATLIYDEIADAGDPLSDEAFTTLRPEIEKIIETRKSLLTAHKGSLDRLLPSLMDSQEYDSVRRRTTESFREYINERILWIRSNNILFSELEIDKSDLTALSPAKWSEAGQQLIQSLGLSIIAGAVKAKVRTEDREQSALDDPSTLRTGSPGSSSTSSMNNLRLPQVIIGSLLGLLLILSMRRFRKGIERLGSEASQGSCVSFWPTTWAILFTFLRSIAIPFVPLLLGLAIVYAPFQGSVLFYALGRALIAASLVAIPVGFLRSATKPLGIGVKHFDWRLTSVTKLKRNLDWILLPAVVLVFVVELLHNLDLSHQVDMLERILFIAGMLLAANFLYRTFNAKSGVFSEYLQSNEKSWANQTSAMWIGSIVFVPVVLALLAFWGYYYTALNLAECGYATLVFGCVAEIIRGMARRFVLVRRRNAFIQTANRKRKARIEAAAAKREEERKAAIAAAAAGGSPVPEVPVAPTESIEALMEIQPEEIEANVDQAYKLISMSLLLLWTVGVWMIWTDVLPALKALDSYTLWPTQVAETSYEANSISAEAPQADAASGEAGSDEAAAPAIVGLPSADLAAPAVAGQQDKRVTVRDFLLFIVIVVVTWIAATNLPSAFEILFLDELPFDRSFRYAIKALTSYAIVLVGVILAFRAISIGWSNVQWLATAFTFGIAFGLQEIFANFVAGIIIMFERPMRIGDLITVDQFTGVVTKIRTRATTIVNWDRKEYLIPNKDFITGRLVNWTLSDAINRIELTVGIAYGSDVDLAKSTLYDIMKKNPKIVDEPSPLVVFNEFADSSLNLVVKCFLADVDSRAQVIDSLHTQINSAFNEAGIEISFPQRDLHLRTIDGSGSDAIANLER